MANFSTVQPVFIKSKDIPDSENRPSVLDMCLASERTAGQGSILGAQNIRGLWRIYPATKEARSEILVKGIRLRGVVLQVSSTNPFILHNETGEERPTTKLWIDNIPISVAESEIEHALKKLGCQLRSDIKMDHARDVDNKWTRFLTGRRFVFITVPPTPLDKFVKVDIFSAKLFHKEQKQAEKTVVCSRCLQPNHHVSQCSGEIVCRQCGKPGHKKGEAMCSLADKHTDATQSVQVVQNKQQEKQQSTKQTKHGENQTKKLTDPRDNSVGRYERGRQPTRQTTILSSLDRSPRDRSNTPKRRRSGQHHSPGQRMEKQSRRSDGSGGRAVTDLDAPVSNSVSVSDSITAEQWK